MNTCMNDLPQKNLLFDIHLMEVNDFEAVSFRMVSNWTPQVLFVQTPFYGKSIDDK